MHKMGTSHILSHTYSTLQLVFYHQVLAYCQGLLIQMACPDALARLKGTALKDKAEEIWTMYFQEQHHLSLSKILAQYAFAHVDAMEDSLTSSKPGLLSFESQESFEQSIEDQTVSTDDMDMGLLVQVTTHSQPLAPVDVSRLCRELGIDKKTLIHMYLEELDAEADFTDRIKYVLMHVNVPAIFPLKFNNNIVQL